MSEILHRILNVIKKMLPLFYAGNYQETTLLLTKLTEGANDKIYLKKQEGITMTMDFETESSLSEVLCAVCIWNESGDCDGDPSCETYKHMEDKM